MKHLKAILTLGILGSIVFFFDSCLEEKFIPDPADPRLPKYTENGNQVGGTLINDVAWKTDFWSSIDMGWNRSFYFTNYRSGDSATLTIDGRFTEGFNKDRPLSFIVVLKNISFGKLEDIKSLDGQTLTLDGTTNYAMIDDRSWTIRDSTDHYYGGIGEITVRSVNVIKNTTIQRQNGEKYNPLIIAGTFEFSFEQDLIHVTSGRFDFYINDNYLDQN
jgi:hypothetical protein